MESDVLYYTCLSNNNAIKNNKINDLLTDYDIKTQNIVLYKCFVKGEKISFKSILFRLCLSIFAKGNAKIYAVYCGKELAHISLVIPKCRKFKFLKKNEYEIGPCYTFPKFRGKGLYPAVLMMIINSHDINTKYYMFVDATNYPSIKGIEKAGFIQTGKAGINRFKNYYLIKETMQYD